MGIVFQTSFDHYSTLTHRFNSVTGISATTSTTAAAGRNGTAGMRQSNSTSTLVAKTLPVALTDIWLAFAYRTSGLPTVAQNRIIAELRNAGVRSIHVRLRTDGTVGVYIGGASGAVSGTLLGNLSGFSMLPNVYYHLELYIRFNATVGLVQFRVNEVERLNLTGQNTGTVDASEIVLAHAGDVSTFQGDFDDVVVRDDQFSGDVEVLALLSTGTGVTDQWTATGAASTREAVDEAAPNSDTDYALTSTVNDLTLLTYPTIPTTSDIRAVVPLPFAKKTDAGTAQICSVFRDAAGPSNHDGATKAPSDGSYEYHPDVWMVNPATAAAFTPAEWNAGQVGFKRTA